MKKAAIFLLTLFLAFFTGCGIKEDVQKNKFTFPDSAAAEYERAYTLNGGKAYDFSLLKTFTLTQTVSVYSPELAQSSKGYPTAEKTEYVYDSRDEIKTRISTVTAVFNADRTKPPSYEYHRSVFYDSKLYEPWFTGGVQQDAAVEPSAYYADYGEYLKSGATCEAKLQTFSPYPQDMFSSFSGGTDGGEEYTISAVVAADRYESFFTCLTDEYAFKSWYAEGTDGSKQYNAFVDPSFIKSIWAVIVTTQNGVKSVTVTVTATPAPEPYFGLEQDITLTLRTVYSTERFSPDTVKVNAAA